MPTRSEALLEYINTTQLSISGSGSPNNPYKIGAFKVSEDVAEVVTITINGIVFVPADASVIFDAATAKSDLHNTSLNARNETKRNARIDDFFTSIGADA